MPQSNDGRTKQMSNIPEHAHEAASSHNKSEHPSANESARKQKEVDRNTSKQK